MFTLLSLCVGIVARKTLRLHLRFRSATLFICWKAPSRMRTALSGIPKLLRPGIASSTGARPQWALDVLKSRAHGADSAASGGDLTLTDPVWRNATCDERNMPSIAPASA
jgi:hypothetical protein